VTYISATPEQVWKGGAYNTIGDAAPFELGHSDAEEFASQAADPGSSARARTAAASTRGLGLFGLDVETENNESRIWLFWAFSALDNTPLDRGAGA
jgi:hypothetical protein